MNKKDGLKRRLTKLFSVSSLNTSVQKEIRHRVQGILAQFLCQENVSTELNTDLLVTSFRDSSTPENSVLVDRYFDLLERTVIPHAVNMSSPHCIGHMTTVPPCFVWPLAELIVALNQNLVKREASKTLTLVERQTLAMIHRWVYRFSDDFYIKHAQNPASTLGVMVSGGTTANITALWIARNRCLGSAHGFEGVEHGGVEPALRYHGFKGAVIIGSTLMHYSLDKAAGVLGLGTKNVIKVPADRAGRIELAALREVIDDCVARRKLIVALVGIAGSTDCGSIDPLQEMAQLAKDFNIHFHVDAAWGTPLLLSRRHCRKLKGIELADSVTADAHKQLHLPIGSSTLLLKQPRAASVIEKRGPYVLQEGSGDLGKHSLEGTRPATSLFVHAALHIIGRRGYEFLVDESIRKAQFMADSIRSRPEFELLLEPETNVVIYRYIPKAWWNSLTSGSLTASDNAQISKFNEEIQRAQSQRGKTFVSRTTVNHIPRDFSTPLVALRAVIGNPFTDEIHLEQVLQDQVEIAADLVS